VIALRTADGLAYAQVVHRVRLYGTLIRVLEPVLEQPAEDVASLVASRERFYTFFPVGAALKRGLVELAGSAPVPERARAFPLLRQRGQIRPDGTVVDWWLWDGERKWQIGRLTPEQRELSIAEVVNDTLLRQRLEEGWRPSDVG
jgi:hypothetical protein